MRKKKPKFQKNTKISAEVAFNNLDPSEKILFHRRHLPMVNNFFKLLSPPPVYVGESNLMT